VNNPSAVSHIYVIIPKTISLREEAYWAHKLCLIFLHKIPTKLFPLRFKFCHTVEMITETHVGLHLFVHYFLPVVIKIIDDK
jgi:hypothetical protein